MEFTRSHRLRSLLLVTAIFLVAAVVVTEGRHLRGDLSGSIDDGLVGHWTLDEGEGSSTAIDSSGQENNGTWQGDAPYYTSGSTSSAGDYAGQFQKQENNQYIDVPDNSTLHPSAGFAVVAWVKPTSFQNFWNVIVAKDSWSAEKGWGLYLDGNPELDHAEVCFDAPGLTNGQCSESVVPLNAWSQIVATVADDGTATVYVNAASVIQGDMRLGDTNGIDLYIGARHTNAGTGFIDNFNGSIDDVRFWNRALSEDEALEIAYGSVGQAAPPTFHPSAANPVDPGTMASLTAAADSHIYYTTDGTDPTTSSTEYSSGFALNGPFPETVKAFGTADGLSDSPIVSATYTPKICGDGVIEGEECDDGNTSSGDGCSNECQIEPGWSCPTPGSACGRSCILDFGENSDIYGLAFTPDGSKLYVANASESVGARLSVVDPALKTIVGAIAIDGMPISVVTIGTNAYVTNPGAGGVDIIDTTTDEQTGFIATGGEPIGLAESADGSSIFAVSEAGDVFVISLASNTVTHTYTKDDAPWRSPFWAAVSGTNLYVADWGDMDSGSVDVIDTEEQTLESAVSLDGFPIALAAQPAGTGDKVFVAQVDGTISVLQGSEVVDTISNFVGGMPIGLTVSPDGSKLYVLLMGEGSSIEIVDTAADTIEERSGEQIQITDPTLAIGFYMINPMVTSPDGKRLYVASSNTLVTVDIDATSPANNTVLPALCSDTDAPASSSSDSSSSEVLSRSSASSLSSSSESPESAGGMRGQGTTTIYSPEYQVPTVETPVHGAASSSSVSVSSSSSSVSPSSVEVVTGDYQVIVPQVMVRVPSGEVQLRGGATVKVLAFRRDGRVAKIELPSGATGFVQVSTIGKKK